MSDSLASFCADIREILADADHAEGRERVRQRLEALLNDKAFCAQYVGVHSPSGVEEIYQDDALGFCVLAYNMAEPRQSPPHDHGDSWAVYGQASGYTDMTLWSIVRTDEPDRVDIQPTGEFRLNPGQAGLFDVGEIHSIQYQQGAKFVRVTGTDMKRVERRVYDHEADTVKVIEQIRTGTAKAS